MEIWEVMFFGLFSVKGQKSKVSAFSPFSFARSRIKFVDASTIGQRVKVFCEVDASSLLDMDVVLYSSQSDPRNVQLGAIQEDYSLAPLSAWTSDTAFGDFIEFVVDEEDRWKEDLDVSKVTFHKRIEGDVVSYGSRQVAGGHGPGNPHGEESELLYYVEQKVLNEWDVDIIVKPELQTLL